MSGYEREADKQCARQVPDTNFGQDGIPSPFPPGHRIDHLANGVRGLSISGADQGRIVLLEHSPWAGCCGVCGAG